MYILPNAMKMESNGITYYSPSRGAVIALEKIRQLSSGFFTTYLASSLLRRHSLGSSRNLPPPRTSAEVKGTYLALCLLAS